MITPFPSHDLWYLFKPGNSRFNQVQRAVQHYFKDKGLDYKELVDFRDNIGHGVIIKG
jgi:hypothetical protein